MRDKETFLERRWFTHSFRLNVLYGNIRSDHGYHFSVFQFFHPFIILFLRYSYMPWDSCIAGKFCFVPRTKIHPFPVCKPYTPDRAIRMIVSLSEIQAETILDDSFFRRYITISPWCMFSNLTDFIILYLICNSKIRIILLFTVSDIKPEN